MEDWEELEALVRELEEANADWSKTAQALRQQMESFKAVTDAIEGHYQELNVEEALRAISTRALGDAARLHAARLNFGLTRSVALIWYPMDDPRPDLSLAPPEGQYSLEVRIGPRYLLGAERDRGAAGDQRLSILIAGTKQLVATLPTSPEKFRAAVLMAFRSPGYSGPPREEAAPPTEPAKEQGPMAETAPEAAAAGDEEAGEQERAGTVASEEASAPPETHSDQADSEEAASASAPEPEDQPSAGVPDSDTPIELPGSSSHT